MKKKILYLAVLIGAITPVFVQADEDKKDILSAEYNMVYNFTENFGHPVTRILTDTSGNNRHGDIFGEAKFTNAYSEHGGDGAYWLSNGDDYLHLPAKDYTAFPGDFMISFYEKSCATGPKVALSLAPEAQKSIIVSFDSNGVGSQVTLNGITYDAGQIGQFTDGRYHHILLRRIANQVELLIDRKKQWTQMIEGPIGISSDFRVSGDEHPWNGAIDNILIANSAWDDAKISAYAISWGAQPLKPIGPWELMTCNAKFLRRDGNGALVFKGKMWQLGGWNPSPADGHYILDGIHYGEGQVSFPGSDGDSKEVWSSTNGKNWKLETQAPWQQRHMAGWTVFKGKMWIVGGDNNNDNIRQDDLWSSVDGINWVDETSKGPFGWQGRVLHHVEVFKNKIWVMGGQRILSADPADHFNDVWNSEDGIHWNLVTAHAAWSPRGIITGSAVFKNKMWIVAGGIYGEKYFNEVWNSADGKKWAKVKQPSPAYFSPRYYNDIHVLDGKLWMMGGVNETGNLNDVYFTEDGVHWTQVAYTDWGGRHAFGVWAYKNSLYVGAGNLWNDVWRLTPSSAEFKALKTFYRDRDSDGFGDKNYPVLAKKPSEPFSPDIKFVANKTDCDDSDINKHPAYDPTDPSTNTCN